jgi:NADPH-dependent 2,4-dienoyl-CoA reductase/sulfur reductase-like enzyme
MPIRSHRYVIVGAGLAGVSAAQAIRERDRRGTILIIGAEEHLPYDRPPLTKQLWTGAKTAAQIFLHDRRFFDDKGITLALGMKALTLDPAHRTLLDSAGRQHRYERLLLATGGVPRRLTIPGHDLEGVFYFRTLDDYLRLRREAGPHSSAVVIGGGFIGSELAAALAGVKVDVTMIFPSPYPCHRVLPEALGRAVQKTFEDHGINVLANDVPTSISRSKHRFLTRTSGRHEIESEIVIVGVGIDPEVSLARKAGLAVQDGVLVDRYLRTSHPGIYAAGDLASFPDVEPGRNRRIEHWDNARAQGRLAGLNMAGGHEPYDYLPYFFSDLFDLGYEAVGEVDPLLETRCDWKKENHTGTIHYLKDGKVKGALMCNVWGKVAAARALILKDRKADIRHFAGVLR